jgi:hypothetical protein
MLLHEILEVRFTLVCAGAHEFSGGAQWSLELRETAPGDSKEGQGET